VGANQFNFLSASMYMRGKRVVIAYHVLGVLPILADWFLVLFS
jgi:hypothetical protein